MPGPKVFVSYSHKDEKALEQLMRFLRPLEREGLLTAWADTRIEGGHDWRKEIERALADATVAVLLVSQDFLISRFITEEEMPRILAREAEGKMTVLPVFLSPSQVDEIGYPDPRTGGRRVLLTKFQGYGTLEKPLSHYPWSQRDRFYKQTADRVKALIGVAQAVLPPAPAASSPAGPARAYELTVQIQRQEPNLVVTYHLPGLEPLGSAEVAWADVKPRIEPIHQMLDTALNRVVADKLKASEDGWGEALFHVLFPRPDLHEKIFRTVFGKMDGPRPNPVFGGVRLRVHTEDSRLSGLPWRLTSWRGQPLVDSGWTFITTHVMDPTGDHLTTAPSNVLVLAPATDGNGGGPHDPDHAQALRDVLRKAWPTGRDPGYVQVATNRAQLEEGLRGLRPHILYIYSPGTVAGGRPGLLLEEANGQPELLLLAELRRLFQVTEHEPAVVYLNTEGLTDPGGLTPDQFLGHLPLLLWRRRPEWSNESTTLALQWLLRWLGQGEDPVAAFHKVQADLFPPSCEAHTLALHSGYRTWRTNRYEVSAKRHYPSLRLDRDHQKSLVRKHLEELVRSGTRRVMALVPYAAPGNSIPCLSDQLRHDLELSLSHLTGIKLIRLQFPESRSNLRHDLEEELKLQLGGQPREPVPHLLRRHAPRVLGPGQKPVLWLDWGTFGTGANLQSALKDQDLETWLQFSSEFLGTQCPDDLRIVSYAALEIPEPDHEDLAQRLKAQHKQPWCRTPAFRLSELQPLGKVAEADLLYFLEDPANSSCDPGIQIEIAERIIARTQGSFEETVALLQEAEEGSWYDLLAQLRREQQA